MISTIGQRGEDAAKPEPLVSDRGDHSVCKAEKRNETGAFFEIERHENETISCSIAWGACEGG
jgi:hypothetical protein